MNMPLPHPNRQIVALLASSPAIMFSGVALARGGAPIVAEWTTATSGDWDDNSRWSSLTFPNNGFPNAGDRYNAVFGADSLTGYTVRLPSDLDISLGTLDIDAQGLTLLVNGALEVEDRATVRQGGVRVTDGLLGGHWDFRDSNLLIESAVFRDFTLEHNAASAITLGTTMQFEGNNDFGGFQGSLSSSNGVLGFTSGAVLDNAQLSFPVNGTQNLQLTGGGVFGEDLSITGGDLVVQSVIGSLTNRGLLDLGRMQFGIGNNFDNSGTLIIDRLDPPSSGNFINRGMLIPGHADLTRGAFTNGSSGTMQIVNDGFASLRGSWQNLGTINILDGDLEFGQSTLGANDGVINLAPGGRLIVKGNQTSESLGTVNNNDGHIQISGTYNNAGRTLTLGDSFESRWSLSNGTITGGEIDATGIRSFATRSGALIDTHLDANTLSLEDGDLRLQGSTTVNTTLLDFVERDGTLILEDDSSITMDSISGRAIFGLGFGAQLTFPKGLALNDQALGIAGIREDPTQLFRNEADITISRGNGIITAGQVQNTGELILDGEGQNGTYYIDTGHLSNEGEIRIVNGGQVIFDGPVENSGSVIVNGAEVSLRGAQTASEIGTWQIESGLAYMRAPIDLSDGPFQIGNYSDKWVYSFATLSDGVIDASPGVSIEIDNPLTLENTQIIGDLTIEPRGDVIIRGDFSAPGGSLTASDQAVIDFSLQDSVDDARINLDGGWLKAGAAFTIGPDATVSGIGRLEMPRDSILTIDGILNAHSKSSSSDPDDHYLVLRNNLNLLNNGEILVTGAARTSAGGILPIVNNGLVATRDDGEIRFGEFLNNGNVQVEGGLFHLLDSLSGDGSIALSGGELRFGVESLDQFSNVSRTGGQLTLTGDLDLSTETLELDSLTGPWRFLGGSVANGTITPSAESPLRAEGVLLDSVLFNGRLTLNDNESVRLRGDTDINGGLALAGTDAVVTLESPWTVVGSTLEISGASSELLLDSGADLTIASDSELRLNARDGWIASSNFARNSSGPLAEGSIINNGLITATGDGDDEGYNLGTTIWTPFVNNGAITLEDRARLSIRDLQGDIGEISVRDSSLTIGGDFTINQPLRIEPEGNLHLFGTWRNESVIELEDSKLTLGGTYDTDDIGDIQADTGSSIALSGLLKNQGQSLEIDNSLDQWSIRQWTIEGGRVEFLSGNPNVSDSLILTEGATLVGDLSMTEEGTRMSLLDGSHYQGIVEIGGKGSEIRVYNQNELSGTHIFSSFNAEIEGDSFVPDLLIVDSIQAEDEFPDIVLGADSSISGGSMRILSDTFTGSEGPGLFTSYGLIHSSSAGDTIAIETVVSTFPAPARSRMKDPNQNRTSHAQGAGSPRTSLFGFENLGTLLASDGGAITIRDARGFLNIIDGELTGGTYIIEDASTIDFGTHGRFHVNKASVTLSGPTAEFSAIDRLLDNYGEFNLEAGHRFTTVRGLDNFGTLAIDSASFIKVNGIFSQELGSTLRLTIGEEKIGKKGLLRSSSTLMLDGTLEILVNAGADLVPGSSWRILTSKGGREGEFAAFITPDLGPHLGFEIQYNANGVTLLVIPSPGAALPFALLAAVVGGMPPRTDP